MVERGRWTCPSIQLTHRLCTECDELEDEMHIFCECKRYTSLRKQYLPISLYKKPSMTKFIDFIHKAQGDQLYNLSIFIFKVFKHYDNNVI